MKEFDYEKWHNIYCNIGLINLKEILTEDDIKVLEKLGYEIKEKLYTKREFDVWLENIISDYYVDIEYPDETNPRKKLEETSITRQRYNELLDKLQKINYYVEINGNAEKFNKKEEIENQNFDIPYYVFEEIVDYIEQTAKGKSKCMKWSNVKAIIRLAVLNNRLSKEQGDFLITTFCRE